MNSTVDRLWHLSLTLLLLLTIAGHAQTPGAPSGQAQPPEPDGWKNDGYVIHQSVEFGYRLSEVTGSDQMYDTLVNLHSGPRLFQQSLSVHSESHSGSFFDNLFVDSFGWGGDANNALHGRIDKDNWYDFRMTFRRDQNFFDYNLLANPLNPPTSSPNLPVTFSPHSFANWRRMSDYDLTLLPLSRLSFRLGYSRNNMTGDSFSTVHEGTDALLYQPWNTTLNSYRFGVDYKPLAQTVISYDQFLDYYKGDTNWQLAPFAQAIFSNAPGTVELGLPIDTANKTPCAVTAPATSLISNGVLTNTACNGYFNYTRSDRIRTSQPSERVSLHSSDLRFIEVSTSFSYSSATMTAPLNEFFNGFVSRSGIRQSLVTDAPGTTTGAKRISNVFDFTVTAHLTQHIRLVDTFRLWDFRIPEHATLDETDWIPPTTGAGACAAPITLLTPISCATPTTSTEADDILSFNQDLKRNQTDLVWDVSKHFGARVGFRYGDQNFLRVNDFATGDIDNFIVHEYTPLFGIWAKPIHGLRLNFDYERTNNDNVIVRVGPRKEARYRVQSTYTPKPWATIGASINIVNQSNGDSLTDYKGYNRNYGFNASLTPRPRFGVDLAYNYNDYQQNAFVCFNDSNTALPVVANAGSCTANGYDDSGNPLLTYGNYTNSNHYGMAAVRFKPFTRVDAEVGYSINSVGGQTPQFNSLQPAGTLSYNYHQPLANIAVDVGHNLSLVESWNYYQYGEKSFVGPTLPRYFHANNATFALRWAF